MHGLPNLKKRCKVASCWIYIGILLGAHYILHISRIRVNYTDVCCSDRLITPCYDRLNHDRIFSSDIPVTSRPPPRGASGDLLWSVS